MTNTPILDSPRPMVSWPGNILAGRWYPPLSKLAEDTIIDCVQKDGVWGVPTRGQKLLRSKYLKAGLLGAAGFGLGYGAHALLAKRQQKTAALSGFIGRIYNSGVSRVGNLWGNVRQPGYMRQFARQSALPLAGMAAGTAAGAWWGNAAWNNAIPPVRALPDLEQQQWLAANQPDYTLDQQTGGM